MMRHGLSVRIIHWAIVSEGIFLLITGGQLNGVFPFIPWDLYSYHIIVGFAFIGTAFIFLYVEIVVHDYRWFAVRRIPYSIKYILSETAAWFGLRHRAEEPIKFDLDKHDYVEKLIPSVIIVWWGYAIFGIILALTGLADAFPATFGFVTTALSPIGIALTGVGGLPFMLALHRLVAVLLVCTVTMHFYASFVYRMLLSIVTGYRDEPAVGGGGDLPSGGPGLGKVPLVKQSATTPAQDTKPAQ